MTINYKIAPEQVAAVYYEEDGMLKRIEYDRSQFDELYASNPQLATYAAGMFTVGQASNFDVPTWHDIPGGDHHIGELLNNKTRTAMDFGTEMHRMLEEYWTSPNSRPRIEIMGGDMLSGPMTNTDPNEANYAEIEKKIMAYWRDKWAEWERRIMYGIVNPPEDKYPWPLDTGRNPAKSSGGKEDT